MWDDNWIGDIGDGKNKAAFKIQKDPTTKATFIPLDGDPATDENNAWVINWKTALPPVGGAKTLLQLLVNPVQPASCPSTTARRSSRPSSSASAIA